MRERGYVGPEEKVEPGLLYPPAAGVIEDGSEGEGEPQGATDESGEGTGTSQPQSKAPA